MTTGTPLPDAVEVRGDELHVPARRRVVAWVTAAALVGAGAAMGILGPGDLAEAPVARIAMAAVAVALGVTVATLGSLRWWFDASVAGRRGLLGRRALPWPEVVDVQLEERVEHTPVGGWAHRLPGGITLSAGPGGSRRGPGRRAGPRVWRPTPVVDLHLCAQDGRDVTVPLPDADVSEAEALVADLADRGWLADEVAREVTVGR